MLLLNFAHPITDAQLAAIEALLGGPVEQIVEIPTRFDPEQPFPGQARALVASIELSSQEWQTTPLLVNLPTLSVIAGLVLAELHGRMGYFPAVLRLKPVPDSVPPRFEVAEILNLQAARDRARQAR